MKKFIALLTLLAFVLVAANAAPLQKTIPTTALNSDYKTQPINESLTIVEKRVRDAAVRVERLDGGHGSGSLIKYKGSHFVLTAQHVTDGVLGQTYLIQNSRNQKLAVLIYSDELNDIALLYLAEHEHLNRTKPMPYKPAKEIPPVGTLINYSGHPASHSLLTFRGSIAGYEFERGGGTQIILNIFGWFGSSGSVIYNEYGRIVGVLWGIDVDYYHEQITNNIVWVSPIQNLDIDLALRPLCTEIPQLVEACK
jgi:S1-C subfamily serine protease